MADSDNLLRRRRVYEDLDSSAPTSNSRPAPLKSNEPDLKVYHLEDADSFWLTRIVLLRAMAFIYGLSHTSIHFLNFAINCCSFFLLICTLTILVRAVVAFLVAYNDNRYLIGCNGLTPARHFLERIRRHTSGAVVDVDVDAAPDTWWSLGLWRGLRERWHLFLETPTLLWFVPRDASAAAFDRALDALAVAGLLGAALVLVRGAANTPLMLGLWLLYHSIVNVGQTWCACRHYSTFSWCHHIEHILYCIVL